MSTTTTNTSTPECSDHTNNQAIKPTTTRTNFERIDQYLKSGDINYANNLPPRTLEARIFDEAIWWKTIRVAAVKQAHAQRDLEMYARQTMILHRMSRIEDEGVWWRMQRDAAVEREGRSLTQEGAEEREERERGDWEGVGCAKSAEEEETSSVEEGEEDCGSSSDAESSSASQTSSEIFSKVWWKYL